MSHVYLKLGKTNIRTPAHSLLKSSKYICVPDNLPDIIADVLFLAVSAAEKEGKANCRADSYE